MDPNVHFKIKKKSYNKTYYMYLIIYINNIFHIDVKPRDMIGTTPYLLRIRDGSITEPSMYIGANKYKWKVQYEVGFET